MKKYGKIKVSPRPNKGECHQNCSICYPEDNADSKIRARRENQKEIEEQINEMKEIL